MFGWSSPPRSAPTTASTGRPSSSARTGPASRAARNTSIPRNMRSGTGTSKARPASQTSFAASTASARESGLAARRHLRFHRGRQRQLICYSRRRRPANMILVVVNLDPHHAQSGWVELRSPTWASTRDEPFQVHDLLSDARYLWHGRAQLRAPESGGRPGTYLPPSPAHPHRTGFRLLHVSQERIT